MKKSTEEMVCRRVRQVEETYRISSDRSEGEIHAVNVFKVFPPSNPGKTGFEKPTGPPDTTDFTAWFNYFVQRIGAAVEKLNAWQFNVLQGGKPNEAEFSAELDSLAADMWIGRTGIHNPAKLAWPLSGVYVCDLLLTAEKSEDKRALLITGFEVNSDYQVVTNCSVVLIQPAPDGSGSAPGDPVSASMFNWPSSSSSSLATSSSSTAP